MTPKERRERNARIARLWRGEGEAVSDELLERARFEAWFLISHRGLPKSSDMRKNSLWMAWQAGARAELLDAAKELREMATIGVNEHRKSTILVAEWLERRAGGKRG